MKSILRQITRLDDDTCELVAEMSARVLGVDAVEVEPEASIDGAPLNYGFHANVADVPTSVPHSREQRHLREAVCCRIDSLRCGSSDSPQN
jgi:hypothetical protein